MRTDCQGRNPKPHQPLEPNPLLEKMAKRLDRPELREKIKNIFGEYDIASELGFMIPEVTDKLLALIPDNHLICKAKLEEAKPDMTKYVSIEDFEKDLIHTENMSRKAERVICGRKIEEAKKQERERIIEAVKQIDKRHTAGFVLQALQGLEEG